MSNNKKNKYGSIPEVINNANNASSDNNNNVEDQEYYPMIDNTQYITETNSDRRKRCMNALAPIIIFVLIMGGLAFALSKDFNHLYPGHGGGPIGEEQTVHHTPVAPQDEQSNDTTRTGATPTNDSVHSSIDTASTMNDESQDTLKNKPIQDKIDHSECSYHTECLKLNLTGSCCPTLEGVMLNCCSS